MTPPTDKPRIPFSDDDLRVAELTGALLDRTRDPGSYTDEEIRMLIEDARADAVIDILDEEGTRRGSWTDKHADDAPSSGKQPGKQRWPMALAPLAAAAVVGVVVIVGLQPGQPQSPQSRPGRLKAPIEAGADYNTLLASVGLDGATNVLSIVHDDDALHLELAAVDEDGADGLLTLVRGGASGDRVPDFHVPALNDLSLLVFAANGYDALGLTALDGPTVWASIDASGAVTPLETPPAPLKDAHERRLETLSVAPSRAPPPG